MLKCAYSIHQMYYLGVQPHQNLNQMVLLRLVSQKDANFETNIFSLKEWHHSLAQPPHLYVTLTSFCPIPYPHYESDIHFEWILRDLVLTMPFQYYLLLVFTKNILLGPLYTLSYQFWQLVSQIEYYHKIGIPIIPLREIPY